MTPLIIASPAESNGGEIGRSIDVTDDPLVCREDRDEIELALSRSTPK
jgi:hypothetical protein